MTGTITYKGLTDDEIAQSRRDHGANLLTPPKKKSVWRLFLEKFKEPLIIVLMVAGVLSIGISCYEYWGVGKDPKVFFEPIGIFAAILLATGLGFIFEMKAAKEFSLLNQVNDDEPVEVIRNGNFTEVPRKDIVVGDIVVISTGMEVPADGELLECRSLGVDESTLTGEPIAHKTTDPALFDKEATFPSNHLMKGTKVMEGHGIMRVFAVGDATENGKVFEAAQIDSSVKTPLNEQLERLGKTISYFAFAIAAIIIVGRLVVYLLSLDPAIDWLGFSEFMLETIMIAVTLIVVSVPEGLPMAVTLSLAYSMRRMLKTNNLVRKLHACETMGAATVICTDKTGTLTENLMKVSDVKAFGDEALLLENMALNSTAELDLTDSARPLPLGNPTEGALILFLYNKGKDYKAMRAQATRLDEVPFSTERKYMASLVENSDGKRYVFVKGAPEIVLSLCKNHPDKATLDSLLLSYQNQAMRTLGFAYAEVDGRNTIADGRLEADNLTFQGIAAISDPVRADVPAAVREALDAGIDIKIVTGDTPATAKEIGRQVGLWDDSTDSNANIITGPEFEALTDREVKSRAKAIKIIARARPLDKKRLVETLQDQGEVVAVTGDGTNDAPALKAAHVGLSMGDGTSVAKEASDITIVDNSFTSIGRAVMWGRSLYRNIQRFVLFQMTVNVVACLIVLVGAFLGTSSPLTVTQMLWVNLIMDTFAAMALAALPPTESVMKDKPRARTAFIITPDMRRFIVGVGATFFILLLALLIFFDNTQSNSLQELLHPTWQPEQIENLTPYETSMFFSYFVFLQFWNMFNARAYATGRSAFHLKDCGEFLLIMAGILVGQIVIVEFGYEFFNVRPLSICDWLIVFFASSPVMLIGEVARAWKNRKRKKSSI